jgi:hypothetical protein
MSWTAKEWWFNLWQGQEIFFLQNTWTGSGPHPVHSCPLAISIVKFYSSDMPQEDDNYNMHFKIQEIVEGSGEFIW